MTASPAASEPATYFRGRILEWFWQHGRDFPWRHTRDPYAILIAEIMLRRTQARQVVPVYEEFLRRYPSPDVLAIAGEGDVAELVRPLGMTWRVPAFRLVAQALVERHACTMPRDRDVLLSLPGVGEYVADAVRSFAFGEWTPVLDTNTVRVTGRYFGFPISDSSRRNASVRKEVARLVDHTDPRSSNAALLDFAAVICRAGRPFCERCPVAALCDWRQTHLPDLIPENA